MSKLAERLRGRNSADKKTESDVRQYLTFALDGEMYAIDILRVQEIRGYEPVSLIPNSPAFLLGVISLRGQVLPVIDLRRRFSLAPRTPDKTAVVIITKWLQSEGANATGILVDAVSDVLDIALSAIQPPPRLGGFIDTAFINGIVTRNEQVIKLVQIDSLFDPSLSGAITAYSEVD